MLVIWRAMLSWFTDSLVPQINSSIIFHICLRNRHQPNWTSHVSFASEYTALQFATHTSVTGFLMVSKVLCMYLLGSKSKIQAGQFTANCLTMPYIWWPPQGGGWYKLVTRFPRKSYLHLWKTLHACYYSCHSSFYISHPYSHACHYFHACQPTHYSYSPSSMEITHSSPLQS